MQSPVIEHVYGDINEHLHNSEYMMSNVIICAHNRNIQNLNEKIGDTLTTADYISYSSQKAIEQSVDLGVEVLNTLEVCGPPSYVSKPKEKMPVMCLRNVRRGKTL